MTSESREDLVNDIMLTVGFAFCVLGFLMGFWYWSFIGVLFVLSGLKVFAPEKDIKA